MLEKCVKKFLFNHLNFEKLYRLFEKKNINYEQFTNTSTHFIIGRRPSDDCQHVEDF